MIEITDVAQEKLLEMLNGREEDIVGMQIAIKGRGPTGFEHSMQFCLQAKSRRTPS